MNSDIDKEVIQMLSDMTGFEPSEISSESHLVRTLGVDSLKIIEIATAIEKKYKFVIREDQMVKINTVNDCIVLVKELLKEKEGGD